MFDLLVFIMIYSFWIACLLLIFLFVLRVYYVIKHKDHIKHPYHIIFIPLSYGVYQYIDNKKFMKLYTLCVIMQFVFMFIASIFILYLRLELTII